MAFIKVPQLIHFSALDPKNYDILYFNVWKKVLKGPKRFENIQKGL